MHVPQRDSGIQRGRDERVPERVGRDGLADPGLACDTADDPPGAVPVQPPPVCGQEHRPAGALADGQVNRPRRAPCQRDGDDLAALRVNARQPVRRLDRHRVADAGADVTALGDVAGVAQTVHQRRPSSPGTPGVPPDQRRRGREAVAGQRRQHPVERVLSGAAVRGWVRQRADDSEQLDHRPGQPCVMINGSAPSWRDLTWMKWMPSPSISVTNCGRALSLASHARQS